MNSLNKELDGKKIKLLEKYENEELNQGEPFLVKGGFGASSFTQGTSLFIESTKTKKAYSIYGMDKIELLN